MNLMNGGKTILVLDSNDQPHEWWKIPLTEFLPPDGHSGHQIESFRVLMQMTRLQLDSCLMADGTFRIWVILRKNIFNL